MFSIDIIFLVFLISSICIGFIGNSVLFTLYMYVFFTQSHLKRPIDLIFIHLTLVNVLTIMFKLIPDVASSFGVRHFLDDVGCKATLYTYRVTRGLSICTTSFLSAVQAITISPSTSTWTRLKSKLSTCIFPSLLFFWIINMFIYINIIKAVEANCNASFVGSGYSQLYCEGKPLGHYRSMAFISGMVIRDLFFVVLMMLSSIYMVSLLYKHCQRAQYVHSPSLSSQTSPEIKATHSILLLVSCFVFFYCANNFITLYLFYRPEKNPRLERITGIISACYPTICPFLLMKRKIISKFTSFISKMRIPFSERTFRR
ncbi:vomeronasal type-1 receptor 3-like [Equus przewalskii]|uniref:Vomeronasal type-1 receptor n=1 Tax=Equus przewalskii TaxID=9798 RepID=A0ABM2F0C6_EQUPR|nr:vomeronasal type-1 receptor 3 [Equus caballus]XP_008525782.1 PREDICTED: vomeronasal type-1 receptor 3-like [Equus przewalskii]